MRVALPKLPTTCQDGGGSGEGKPAAASSQRGQRQGQEGGMEAQHKEK